MLERLKQHNRIKVKDMMFLCKTIKMLLPEKNLDKNHREVYVHVTIRV